MDTIVEPLLANTYPAAVRTPDGDVLDKLRVVLSARTETSPPRLTVYAEAYEGKQLVPYIAHRIDLASARPDPDRVYGWIVTDLNAREWTFWKSDDCGCGSMIRHFRAPFPLF